MTTEISIMNKNAVAIAADSAVTTIDKVFPTANKIFALSLFHPVGVMIYNNASYCGIPWETIIKSYRNYLGNKTFDELSEYGDNFINFLKNDISIISNIQPQDFIILKISTDLASKLQNNIAKTVQMRTYENEHISEDEISEIVKTIIIDNYNSIKSADKIVSMADITIDNFSNKFKQIVERTFEKYFLNRYEQIIPDLQNIFLEMVYYLITTNIFPCGYTGLVITGYGDKQIFPSLIEYKIGYYILNELQIENGDIRSITSETEALVNPFAQDDVISMFMEGIHPKRNNSIQSMLESILNEYGRLLSDTFGIRKKKLNESMDTIKNINSSIVKKVIDWLKIDSEIFASPIVDIISVMQPIELANLAESLVNITSMHRQVSKGRETVGGPTDVALISKGDGFIWIKRKHYFDPKLNPDFCRRRYEKY